MGHITGSTVGGTATTHGATGAGGEADGRPGAERTRASKRGGNGGAGERAADTGDGYPATGGGASWRGDGTTGPAVAGAETAATADGGASASEGRGVPGEWGRRRGLTVDSEREEVERRKEIAEKQIRSEKSIIKEMLESSSDEESESEERS